MRSLTGVVIGCLTVASAILLLAGCQGPPHNEAADAAALAKIEIDLTQLDEQGLRGPANGKVAVSYEFAIPDTAACREEVARIDRTVELMRGSPGRIGAGKGQCLCIGHTHQPHFRETLLALARLPYVGRIIVCHFE